MKKNFFIALICFLITFGIIYLTKEKIYNVNKGSLTPLGNHQAPVVIIEFGDYLCPYCAQASLTLLPEIEKLAQQNKIVFYYRDFVLHPGAQFIANAAWCANEQGNFWNYHKKLFENFLQGNNINTKEIWLKLAENLNLDLKKFENCIDNNKYLNNIIASTKEALQVNVRGTPTFFVNGHKIEGLLETQKFKSIINKFITK